MLNSFENSTDLVIKEQLMKKYTQSNVCLEKLHYIRSRQSKKLFADAFEVVKDDLRSLQIEINALEEIRRLSRHKIKNSNEFKEWLSLPDEFSKEEELYNVYNEMNKVLWHLVTGEILPKEYEKRLAEYYLLKGKIARLESDLYCKNIKMYVAADNASELEKIKSSYVSEAILNYDKIRMI